MRRFGCRLCEIVPRSSVPCAVPLLHCLRRMKVWIYNYFALAQVPPPDALSAPGSPPPLHLPKARNHEPWCPSFAHFFSFLIFGFPIFYPCPISSSFPQHLSTLLPSPLSLSPRVSPSRLALSLPRVSPLKHASASTILNHRAYVTLLLVFLGILRGPAIYQNRQPCVTPNLQCVSLCFPVGAHANIPPIGNYSFLRRLSPAATVNEFNMTEIFQSHHQGGLA